MAYKAGVAALSASMLLRGAFTVPTLDKRTDATAAAAPGTPMTINFDDIVVTDPLFHFQSLPPTGPLHWPSFGVSILGANTGIQSGVAAHSGSQAAVLVPTLHSSLNPTTPQPPPLIPGTALTPPPNVFGTATGNLTATGPTASFDLKSFWFGCALATFTSVASVPQACQLDVYGYKSAAAAAASPPSQATFVFWGGGGVAGAVGGTRADMVAAVLPAGGAFDGLREVVFVRRVVGPLDAATESVVVDDVAVVVY